MSPVTKKERAGQALENSAVMSGYRFLSRPLLGVFAAILLLLVVACGSGSGSNASSAVTDPPDDVSANSMGINISWPTSYDPEVYYADIMKTAALATPSSGEAATYDSNGWPMFKNFAIFILWAGPNSNQPGTYAISFHGVADSIGPGWSATGPQFSALKYDAATNTTTGTFTPAAADLANNFWITVVNAYRDAARTQRGLTDLKIMRPDPTTGKPFAPTVLFNTPMQALAKKFSVVRYIHFLGIETVTESDWSDRRPPGYALVTGDYKGKKVTAPWEHVVLFSNLTNTDPWINIPLHATDDYVQKLAQLFAFGSDGNTGLPYTGPFGSSADPTTNPRPALHDPATWVDGTTSWYPPLKSNLKLYVEWYDELWNWAYPWNIGTGYVTAQAQAAVVGSPSFYDANHPASSATYIAMRTAQFSLIFRRVFGDAAMMSHVRPVLASQGANPIGTLSPMLLWAYNYLGNADGAHLPNSNWVIPGTSTQVTAHPLSYYWYGAGGAAYYNPTDGSSVNAMLTTGEMDVGVWTGAHGQLRDMPLAHVFGLKRIAYEGGPDVNAPGSNQALEIEANMAFRPAVPNMQDVFEAHHDHWSQQGGDLLVYFVTSQLDWAVLPVSTTTPQGNVYSLNSPKLLAIDALRGRPRAAPAVGAALNVANPGTSYAFSCSGYVGSVSSSSDNSVVINPDQTVCSAPWGNAFTFTGYLFSIAEPTSGSVQTVLSGVTTGMIEVLLDGVSLGSKTAVNGAIEFPAGAITKGVHGVIVRSSGRAFKLMSVKMHN